MPNCCECRNGDHENYDDDVRRTLVREPDHLKVVLNAYLCGEHRTAAADDGFVLDVL
jgi:hypothetical protein